MAQLSITSNNKTRWLTRGILLLLVLGMAIFKLALSYKGLDQPMAMDQAQIARNVAQGEGFTSNFMRPMEVKNASTAAGRKPVDFKQFKDTNHAPLNIAAIAAALKLTGHDDVEKGRMSEGGGYIYAPDRVVSATSMAFFIIAMVLAYTLAARMFDETVAFATVVFLALSELMLEYAVSGLPQMLMMCCMLASLHCMLSAIKANENSDALFLILGLAGAFIFIALMCLAGWLSIWCALGLIIFCAFHFRPFGAYAIPGLVLMVLTLFVATLGNKEFSTNILGNAYYNFYNCLGGNEELILRTTNESNIPFNSSGFILRLLGHVCSQFSTLYVNMGSILVTPFFVLALLNRYKSSAVEGIKWAAFCMWIFACIGMGIFGINTPLHGAQTAILFAPLFTAFGIALLFNTLSRLKLDNRTFTMARGLAIFMMVLISAGPFLFNLPKDIYQGIWLSDRGRPNFPPYYPPALNIKLANLTTAEDIVVTDQPWAVAWYADRKALWMPLYIDDYANTLQPIFRKAGVEVQGFLVTPSSHSPLDSVAGKSGGITGISERMGDFAPLAMEGKLLLMVPKHNMAFADYFAEKTSNSKDAIPMGHIVSSRGQFPNRHFLLGTEIVYYSK
ncbi:MAG: hypothetical protein IKV82_01140 [Akkermansia sp.]|nr:hypothetical protein [Akkermansia sp.]